ncbi:hypothetical protein [Rhodococcus aerolatus]
MRSAAATDELVTPEENYLKTRASLVRIEELVEPYRHNVQERLASYPSPSGLVSEDLIRKLPAEITRLEHDPSFTAAVRLFQTAIGLAESPELLDRLRGLIENVLRLEHPTSRFFVVETDRLALTRGAFLRALTAAEFGPEVFSQPEAIFEGFNGARSLIGAFDYGLQPFISPALLTLAPWVTGIAATRPQATIVWLFDYPVIGKTEPSTQLMDLARSDRATTLHQSPMSCSFTQREATELLLWWSERINTILRDRLDPTNFVVNRSHPKHDPARQTAYGLSLEQVFTDLVDLLSSTRRNQALRVKVLWDVLDALEGMRILDFRTMTTPSKVRQAITDLRSTLPPSVAPIALWRCEAAADALDDVQKGFTPTTRARAGGLEQVPRAKGTGDETVQWDDAIPDYLRVVRNLSHAAGSKVLANRRQKHLLMSHTGELGESLPDLAYLWLLRIVADPSLAIAPQIEASGGP